MTDTAPTPAPVVPATTAAAAVPAPTIASVIESDAEGVKADVESVWTKVKPYVLVITGVAVGYVIRSLI